MSDSDARGRLAPVSYLPWAAPGVDPVGDIHARLDAELVEAERAVESMQRLLQSSGGLEDPGAVEGAGATAAGGWATSEREAAAGSATGSGSASASADDGSRAASGGRDGGRDEARGRARGRLRAIDGGVRRDGAARHDGAAEVDEAPAETGAERDARIDRLVVSRLRRSSLSVSEVRDVLAEHGLDDAEIEEWIERYERLGYLDDARLAEQLVHVQVTRRGRGSGAILSELTRRGVDAGVARAALDALDGDAERDQAFAIAERRARQLSGLDRSTAERRLSAFLQRRGYAGGLVREVVSEVLSGERS